MAENFSNAGIYLVQTFFGLYLLMLMLRFLSQASRVDFYNPICQAIVRLTNPPVRPLKQIIPAVRGVDFATLLVALILQIIAIMVVMTLKGYVIFHPAYVAWSLLGLFSMVLDIYFFSLLIMVIASWLAPQSNHPAITMIYQITDPICTPARKLLPPMGGIDFSIIVVFVSINIIDSYLVIKPLAAFLGVPRGLILGL